MTSLRVARWLAAALALAAAAALVSALAGRPIQVSLPLPWLGADASVGVAIDIVRGVLLCLVTGIGAVVAWYSSRNLTGQQRLTRFAVLELGVVMSLAAAVATTSLVLLAAAWTLASLAISGLVGHVAQSPAAVAARQVRARLLVGDALLWASVLVIGGWLGTWSVDGLPDAVADGSPLVITSAAVLLVGAGIVRSALVPAHRWLPETAAAPSPVSALLHAGVVNGVGVLALLTWPLVLASGTARVLLVVVGITTALVATAQSRTRVDVKGRLAASTSSQMGYLAIQVGLGIPAAALAHIVGHGVWKAAQFLGAGDVIARSRSADARPQKTIGRGARLGLVAAASVVVLTAAYLPMGALPALSAPAELLPIAVALIITVVAVVAVARSPLALGARAGAAAVVLVGASIYLVGLRALTLLLEPERGLPAGWRAGGAVLTAVAVALVIAVFGAGLLVDRSARAGRARSLVRRTAFASLRPLTVRERLAARTSVCVSAPPVTQADADDARHAVQEASAGLARLYPLTSFVASNPLAGLEDRGIVAATAAAIDLWDAAPGPSADTLSRALAEGRASEADIDAVVAEEVPTGTDSSTVGVIDLRAIVRHLVLRDDASPLAIERAREAMRAMGLRTQRRLLTPMDAARVPMPVQERARELGHHICARAMGRAAWPGADGPWRELRASAAVLDLPFGARGAEGVLTALPLRADEALAALLEALSIEPADRAALLGRLLARDPGWPGHLLWRQRHDALGESAGLASTIGEPPADLLVEVAAVRLAIDVIVADAHLGRQSAPMLRGRDLVQVDAPSDMARMLAALGEAGFDVPFADAPALSRWFELLQPFASGRLTVLRARILEHAYGLPLITSIGSNAATADPDTARVSTAAQLVMCIDVRSERLRRRLEARGPWETFGAAGFFGLPVRYQSARDVTSERAPALLRPTVAAVDVASAGRGWSAVVDALASAVRAVERTPGAVFGWAEAAGWAQAPWVLARTLWPAATRTLTMRAAGRSGSGSTGTLELDATADRRVEAAAGFLMSTGLVEFAPVVVLCGHGATATNNPHVAAYDCGACGGAAGDVSARVMVEVLNEPIVRAGLRDRGIAIPDATTFVAAIHDTTTDTVRILEHAAADGQAARVLADLLSDVADAGGQVRSERIDLLPDAPRVDSVAAVSRAVGARAADWAQPRPEWGLAGASAIVVGPRSLTRGLDLDGRVFLQSYRADIDPDGAVLEQLLAAPVVVAQWITSQYWASTVDPYRFGAGDKTTHNIVGDLGSISAVMSGARGDLRLGLPWQAVSRAAPRPAADGDPWSATTQHQPQRLLVVVHADAHTVDAAIDRQPGVAQLIRGEWITLCAIDPGTGAAQRRGADGGWSRVEGQRDSLTVTADWAMTA